MKRIFVRPHLCTGCKTCELVCAVGHSASRTLFGALLETPRPQYRLFVEAADGHKVPVLCRHCEDAPCVSGCIAGALTRDSATGAVVCDQDKCVGCWTCIMLCPYGVVGRHPDLSRAVKCDLCLGRPGGPACVESCPTRALLFEEVEAFAGERRVEAALAAVGAR